MTIIVVIVEEVVGESLLFLIKFIETWKIVI